MRGETPHQSPNSNLSTPSSSLSQTPSLPSSQFPSPMSSSSQFLGPFAPQPTHAPSPFQLWQQQHWPNFGPFNPFTSTPETVASPSIGQQSFPVGQQSFSLGQQSFPFHPNILQPQTVASFPRRSKDEAGRVQFPGLRDLPPNIQHDFRNTFIRHMMKVTFSGTFPWSNPSLDVYQEEFNAVYPGIPSLLHADDAVVYPVSPFDRRLSTS